jgi:ubiquinone/menaquinone biosynthesis C-methylase UbiE
MRGAKALKPNDQIERVITQFTAQSRLFNSPAYSLSNQESLAWAIKSMRLSPHMRIIDVAAGTGLLSLAAAPYVKSITAVDITRAMLDEGEKAAQARGITNVSFSLRDAYNLGEKDAYDLAMSRLSFHHFESAKDVLLEMIAAVNPGGRVAVFDLLSPDDAPLSARYNAYERLRDDSHTTALTADGLYALFVDGGLENIETSFRYVVNDLHAWMDLTNTPPQNRETIRRAITDELSGGEATGFLPFIGEDGNVKFKHRWMMCMGEKPLR